MKILAFVDNHGDQKTLDTVKKKTNDVDVLVCAGDITIFEDKLKSTIKELADIGKPLIIVHGNHEFATNMSKICSLYENVHFIHEAYCIIDEVLFLGYGGGGFSTIDKKFDDITKEFKKILKKNPKKKVVLVTHAPPHKTKLDMLDNQHFGNKSIYNFIVEEQPMLSISGHFHETAGMIDKIDKTLVVNPGQEGKLLLI